MAVFRFPDGFLWGSATSAYQVEGGIVRNDWAWYAQQGRVPYAGQAVDFYQRYREDVALIHSLKQNAHRFSLEWSRIQPEAGVFDEDALAHYRQILMALREKGIKTVLTLHHFTNPLWFQKAGGWEGRKAVQYFQAYADRVAREFSSLVDYWITINEPLVFLYNGYLKGIWPPHKRSLSDAWRVWGHLQEAHDAAYAIIHGYAPGTQVSIAKHLRLFVPCSRGNVGQNHLPAFVRNRLFNRKFLETCLKHRTLDFIGVNYYTVDFLRWSLHSAVGDVCQSRHHPFSKNTLGWYDHPEGLYLVLKMVGGYGLPVFITENGTTQTNDQDYREYLCRHIQSVARALLLDIRIIGYLWWSLIDNFEWDQGYTAYFGLCRADSEGKRIPRPFADVYRRICGDNAIEL